jgi:hypothetical protein
MTYRLAKTRHHYMQKPDNQQGGTPHRLLIYIAYFTILAGDPELNGGRLFTVRTPPGITGRNHVPHSSFAGCWMATSILLMSACSRSGDRAAAQLHKMSIAEQAEIAKRYDPSALAEVTSISNLPDDLKSHFKGWLGQRSEHPGPPL